MAKNGQIRKEHLDQYFTPASYAKLYAEAVVARYGTHAMYLEPSAGAGVFVDALIAAGVPSGNIYAIDVDPARSDIHRFNALNLGRLVIKDRICVGNLPFGKGGAMAIRIMNHLHAEGAKALCFLNPICIGHKHFTLKILASTMMLVDTMEFPRGTHFEYPNDPNKDLSKPNPVSCEFQFWEVGNRQDPCFDCRETDSFEIMNVGVGKVITPSGRVSELTMAERGITDVDFTIISHGKNAGTIKAFEPEKDKANVKLFVKVKPNHCIKTVRAALVEANLAQLTQWSTIAHNPSIAPSEIIELVKGTI